MNVKELIKALESISDENKTLPVNVHIDGVMENNWVVDIDIKFTHSSGYEVEGEVTLLTSE